MPSTPDDSNADSRTCEPPAFPIAEQNQLDFDISFYSCVLDRNPDYVDVLRCQGELLSRKGDFSQALLVEQRLAALTPADAIVRYNLACTYAKAGFANDALSSLKAALELGYTDFDYLDSDPDLDALRRLPQFDKMLSAFRARN